MIAAAAAMDGRDRARAGKRPAPPARGYQHPLLFYEDLPAAQELTFTADGQAKARFRQALTGSVRRRSGCYGGQGQNWTADVGSDG
jgi:hypothetical protein